MGWQLGWDLCSPGWGIPSTPPGGHRTRVSVGWEGGDRGVRGAGGAGGARGGGNTHIHYDSHASNESNKVKGESPTGKRKQTVLRRAPGSRREEDGPTGPRSRFSHPPRPSWGSQSPPWCRDNDTRQEGGGSHLASRNFLSRLGRSWLRRRRNQRSTWRTVQPLFLESISTSAWGHQDSPTVSHSPGSATLTSPRHLWGPPSPHLLGVFAGGSIKLLQHRIGGGF